MKQSLLNLHLIACSRYPKLSGCSLCSGCSYPIIWQTINFRVVLINDHAYPGYCRIESIAHIKEMTDLTDALQKECLQLLLNIEKGLRKLLAPDKINLASLGNSANAHFDRNHILNQCRKTKQKQKQLQKNEPRRQRI